LRTPRAEAAVGLLQVHSRQNRRLVVFELCWICSFYFGTTFCKVLIDIMCIQMCIREMSVEVCLVSTDDTFDWWENCYLSLAISGITISDAPHLPASHICSSSRFHLLHTNWSLFALHVLFHYIFLWTSVGTILTACCTYPVDLEEFCMVLLLPIFRLLLLLLKLLQLFWTKTATSSVMRTIYSHGASWCLSNAL
jgi:hypothetical protein